MDDNELEDRARQRWFIGLVSFCVVLPIVLGVPAILLQYNQGALLADIVKIVLGFLGGAGAGAVIGDCVGNEGYPPLVGIRTILFAGASAAANIVNLAV